MIQAQAENTVFHTSMIKIQKIILPQRVPSGNLWKLRIQADQRPTLASLSATHVSQNADTPQ